MPAPEEELYKDLPLSFNRHPITKKVNALVNADAVKQAVKNIVLTNFYERPYNPRFGGNITAQLFENADPFLEYNLATNIRQSLENFEPRADIISIIVNSEADNNTLSAKIKFGIRALMDPVEVTVQLQRVR
jgi:phage baseplate assembly protein W